MRCQADELPVARPIILILTPQQIINKYCSHKFCATRPLSALRRNMRGLRACFRVIWRATLRRGRVPGASGRDGARPSSNAIGLRPQAALVVCGCKALRVAKAITSLAAGIFYLERL